MDILSRMVAVALALALALVPMFANAVPEVPVHCQLIGKAAAYAVMKRKEGVPIEQVYEQVIRATQKPEASGIRIGAMFMTAEAYRAEASELDTFAAEWLEGCIENEKE